MEELDRGLAEYKRELARQLKNANKEEAHLLRVRAWQQYILTLAVPVKDLAFLPQCDDVDNLPPLTEEENRMLIEWLFPSEGGQRSEVYGNFFR